MICYLRVGDLDAPRVGYIVLSDYTYFVKLLRHASAWVLRL
jgi:hypothetical protein